MATCPYMCVKVDGSAPVLTQLGLAQDTGICERVDGMVLFMPALATALVYAVRR